MRILGMISGTSHDGIDMAIIDFRVDSTDQLVATIDYVDSKPYSTALRASLMSSLPPADAGFEQLCKLDTNIGRAFADAALTALSHFKPSQPVDAICTHGQTVFHWVEHGKAYGTLQIGQPAWMAESTGLPVISNVRTADIAAGGEGAPLVPILDQVLLTPYCQRGLVCGALNLGGISNITVCAPSSETRAWDIGPANALIDACIADYTAGSETYDRDGRIAQSGKVNSDLLNILLREPYYALLPPKSSGKELFNLEYVRNALKRYGQTIPFRDVIATLSELTAITVADTINNEHVAYLIASGGGIHNPVIMNRMRKLAPNTMIVPSDHVGIPADAKEAIAFALIGWATLHGLPSNVPSCTGASSPRVLGEITPAPYGSRRNGKGISMGGGFPAVTQLAHWPHSLIFTTSANGKEQL